MTANYALSGGSIKVDPTVFDASLKGRNTRSGERIYHVPDAQHYERTRISPGKGERWFCSEREARAVGWRKSKR